MFIQKIVWINELHKLLIFLNCLDIFICIYCLLQALLLEIALVACLCNYLLFSMSLCLAFRLSSTIRTKFGSGTVSGIPNSTSNWPDYSVFQRPIDLSTDLSGKIDGKYS